jgi:hypothetical protein
MNKHVAPGITEQELSNLLGCRLLEDDRAAPYSVRQYCLLHLRLLIVGNEIVGVIS